MLVEQRRGGERQQELQGQDHQQQQDAATGDLPELLVAQQPGEEQPQRRGRPVVEPNS